LISFKTFGKISKRLGRITSRLSNISHEAIGGLLMVSNQHSHCFAKIRRYSFHQLYGKEYFYWNGRYITINLRLKALLRDEESSKESVDSKAINISSIKYQDIEIPEILLKFDDQNKWSDFKNISNHWFTTISQYPSRRRCITSRAISRTRRLRSSTSLSSLMQKAMIIHDDGSIITWKSCWRPSP